MSKAYQTIKNALRRAEAELALVRETLRKEGHFGLADKADDLVHDVTTLNRKVKEKGL